MAKVIAYGGGPKEQNVKIVSGSTAGTEYTEGDVDATIAGTAILGESSGNTLNPVQLDASKNLNVNVNAAIPAGTNVVGIVRLQDAGGDEISVAAFPASDNAAVQNTIATSAFPLMFDGTTWDRVRGDSTDGLLVNLGGNNDVSLNAGTNAIGKLAANSGVDIGDVDVTSVVPGTGATNLGKAEDGGHTSGDVGVMSLGVRNDTPNAALSGTDLDYSPIAVYRTGAIRVAPPEEDFAALGSNSVKKYYTSAGAVTDGIIWSPAAGKRWYVTDIFINVSAAATVTLEDDLVAGDSAVWKAELAANSGWSHSFSTPLFSGEDAADLIITTSAGNVYVTVTGYEI